MDLNARTRAAAWRMADVATQDMSRPVTRYPGWSMLDLLVHTGAVYQRTIEVIETLAQDRVQRSFPPDEEPETVIEWFRDGVNRMVYLLDTTPADTAVWGFGDNPTVGTWSERMLLETDVHRYDAEASVGVATRLDPEVAALGIEEFVTMWGGSLDVPVGAVITLAATDTERAWRVQRTESGCIVTTAVSGDVSATASDLYLWMLARVALEDLDGEVASATAWDAAFRALPDARR